MDDILFGMFALQVGTSQQVNTAWNFLTKKFMPAEFKLIELIETFGNNTSSNN